jgi:diacylglycerol kinase family enzyme
MTNSLSHSADSDDSTANQVSPLFVILNAGSGDKNAAMVSNKLANIFAEAQQPYELFLCHRPGDIAEMTRQAIELASQRNGVVVGAGGDGTIRFIAQEVVAAGLRFGIIPLGTFNYFARDNDIPLEVDLAAEALVAAIRAGNERQVQVGQLNDQTFLVNASLGLYPQLLVDREKLKKQHGRSRVVAKLAALLTLLKRDINMLLRIEYRGGQQESGESVVPASTIFVGNNAHQLADIGLEDEAEQVKGGQLAIIALPPMRVSERAAVAFHGLFGILHKAANVTHFACNQLVVEPLSHRKKRTVKVAMDGEVAQMQPPLTFRVGPTPLRLIVAPVSPGDGT